MKLPWLLVAMLAAIAAPVAAQSSAVIIAARSAGQIGERYDGYLGFAVAPSPQLRTQVESVNIRRRAFYSDLASKRGASRVEVGITAGCELFGRVPVGEAYLLGDNVWRRRAPGQTLPIPAYCRP